MEDCPISGIMRDSTTADMKSEHAASQGDLLEKVVQQSGLTDAGKDAAV